MRIYRVTIIALCGFFVFGCGAVTPKAPTPTETLKTFVEASKTKDVETIKKTLSKGTLDIIKKTADAQETTVDELLKKDSGTPVKEMPETRNEKIEGDTATVEVKNIVSGEFETTPFIKEDGNWKIALDKLMQDMQKKATEQMKMPPAPEDGFSVNPDGAAKPKMDSSKPKTDK